MRAITIGMIIILFVTIGIIGSDFYLLWLPLEHSPEYPAKVAALFMAVTALVTLFLALATFNATEQSNLRERERREAEIEKEKRDRKERLLKKIIEWAEDVATCELKDNISEPLPIFTRLYEKEIREYDFKDKEQLVKGIILDNEHFWHNQLMNLHKNYQILDIKGEHILSLCDTKYLENIINTVRTVKAEIGDYQERLFECMKDMNDASKKQNLQNKVEKLNQSAIQLIKEATKIKTKDIT